MSGYEALLEKSFQEEEIKNDTFASVGACLESLTAFVNEDVDFSVTISLNEAEDEAIDNKKGKISAAIKNGLNKLIAKLKEFINKIGDAVKRFVTKAKIAVANCGNDVMKKILGGNEKAVIGSDIKVKTVEFNGKKGAEIVNTIFNSALMADAKLHNALKNNGNDTKEDFIFDNDDTDDIEHILDTITADVAGSDIAKDVEIAKADKVPVKDAYNDYVAIFFDPVKKNLNDIEKSCKDSQKAANSLIKYCNKTLGKGDAITTELTNKLTKYSNLTMKLSTQILNYSMSIVTLGTKNSAKIALAAINDKGEKVAKAVGNTKAGAAANKAMLKAEEKKSEKKAAKEE